MSFDTFVDDSANVRDLYICMKSLVGYIPGRVDNGLENF